MKRREMLGLVATVGGLSVAGCLGDDDSSGTPEAQATNQPGNGTDASTTWGEGSDAEDGHETEKPLADPEVIVGTFYTALDDADIETANRLIHKDSEMDRLSDDEIRDDEAAEMSVAPQDVEVDGRDALVEVLLTITEPEHGEITVPLVVDLRIGDSEWKLWEIRDGDPKNVPGLVAEFDTDHENGRIQITHVGGDEIPATELYVRGEGLDATGSWESLGGETSDDELMVRAGDSVTVETDDSYEIRVVWEGEGTTRTFLSLAGARETATDESGTIDSDTR